jgi:hypothetical protein
MKYKVNTFSINVGFSVNANNVAESVSITNGILHDLPASLYRSLDFKTTSAIVGSIFCEVLAGKTDGIVNPIEKGHPDLVPSSAKNASEAELRNYERGLEIKCTIGNVEQGSNLRAGQNRIGRLTGITWQAHHREVKELMGLVWDFVQAKDSFNSPGITGVFYASDLKLEDWGTISGTTGRNTKVSGMRSSGKEKMGAGWIVVIDDKAYISAFQKMLGISRKKLS